MRKEVNKKITALIVDDHVVVRRGLTTVLSASGLIDVTREASTGEEAINYLENNLVDVVVMDHQMPGMNGFEASKIILNGNPAQKILVLSAFTDEPLPSSLLSIGVAGCINKTATPEETIEAILKAYAEASNIEEKTTVKPLENSFTGLLSKRELQILAMLVKGLSVKRVAANINLSESTVYNHRSNIFSRLKVKGVAELSTFAINNGPYFLQR